MDRRQFITRGATLTAGMWAAPQLQSVAHAQGADGTPPVCPCISDAFGLRVIIPALGIDVTLGVDGCVIDTGVIGAPGTATVAATVVCGEASSDATGCRAAASIATLDVVVGSELAPTLTVNATVLASNASATCDPCNTRGAATVTSLAVNNLDVNVTGTCNNDVLGLGLVTFNEQTCAPDGTLSVNALHINVAGIAEVIAAHSEAGAEGCPCTPCA